MELRVGSNIMIHFLYILLLLIWHIYMYLKSTCILIIHCYYVSCDNNNYMYYVCET